jgi:RNA polymerase sigma factor (sigma-70 family)
LIGGIFSIFHAPQIQVRKLGGVSRIFLKDVRASDCSSENAMNSNHDSVPTRASLLLRLRDVDDQKSWQAFFETYWRLIYGFAVKQGLSPEDAEEVVQDTVLSIARGIDRFRYDPAVCPFKAWLMRLTRARIADLHRKRSRSLPSVTAQEIPEGDCNAAVGDCDLTAIWNAEWEKNLIDSAMEQIRYRVSPLHFQIFDCHIRQGWTADETAKSLGVSKGMVYLTKHRVSLLLSSEMRRIERHPFPEGKRT